jgi:hypothetical protein
MCDACANARNLHFMCRPRPRTYCVEKPFRAASRRVTQAEGGRKGWRPRRRWLLLQRLLQYRNPEARPVVLRGPYLSNFLTYRAVSVHTSKLAQLKIPKGVSRPCRSSQPQAACCDKGRREQQMCNTIADLCPSLTYNGSSVSSDPPARGAEAARASLFQPVCDRRPRQGRLSCQCRAVIQRASVPSHIRGLRIRSCRRQAGSKRKLARCCGRDLDTGT